MDNEINIEFKQLFGKCKVCNEDNQVIYDLAVTLSEYFEIEYNICQSCIDKIEKEIGFANAIFSEVFKRYPKLRKLIKP